MDKPMTFDEVFKDAYDYWIDDANIHRYEGAKGLADQVWQHQQAKVEELQKRVDKAQELVAGIKDGFFGECYEVHDIAKKLEQVLKGGRDE